MAAGTKIYFSVECGDDGKYEYSKSGNYYFVMDADAKSALTKALEFHGQKAKISKFIF